MSKGIGGKTAAEALATLRNMTEGLSPVPTSEYRERLSKAQALMQQQGIAALYIDAGSNLNYFTGVVWYPSERMVGAILPAVGDLHYIVPAFEEGTFRGMMLVDGPVHCWHEHEDPYRLLHHVLEGMGVVRSRLAVDEATPFFRLDGMSQALHGMQLVNGKSVSNACRSRKSATELALMQRANDMTLHVQRAAASILREGISTQEVKTFIDQAHQAVGASGSDFCIVLFGADTAFPHGVKYPKKLEVGEMVLIDTGCNLYGYRSDITRTYVFGEANARQREVWGHEQTAQRVAYEAAQLGTPCGAVDDAMRAWVTAAGYGPAYALPGVPHRTGHGIGLDIHESPNLVGNDPTPLAPGMCFSVEPMICVPGEFGIRHEDHIYMTEQGPRWFTQPALSIDDPFGNMAA
ncbi:M24 family metallopeptidase [Leeia sp.]|uniref:M24 family metallopeptidase n=1 Tax=Leeia sp. TaxID=2884678 RepID=UPI0035B4D5DD